MSFFSALAAIDFWAFVLVIAGINAIFVLGLQLQAGTTGLLNFGHVGFMAAGAYTMGLLLANGVTLWLALPAALVAGAVFGLVVGIPTLRLRSDYFAITTIAAGEIFRIVMLNNPGSDPEDPASGTGGSEGLRGASGPWKQFNRDVIAWFHDHLSWDINRLAPILVLVWVVAALVGLFLWYLSRSPWGRVLKAIRENEDATAALGKNVFAYKLQALALGATVAALAGVMFTFQTTTLYPDDFLPIVTFTGFAILILGGVGSYVGVFAGTLVISFIQAITRFVDFPINPEKAAALRWVLIGLIIMAIMAFRPQGLFGKKEELYLDV